MLRWPPRSSVGPGRCRICRAPLRRQPWQRRRRRCLQRRAADPMAPPPARDETVVLRRFSSPGRVPRSAHRSRASVRCCWRTPAAGPPAGSRSVLPPAQPWRRCHRRPRSRRDLPATEGRGQYRRVFVGKGGGGGREEILVGGGVFKKKKKK